MIFASDNGPWLNLPDRMLQGGVLPWHAGFPGHLRGAKHTTYEGGPRVPCIIRWPGQIKAGRVSAEIATVMDLYVTLVKAGGGKLPDHPVDGHDLSPFLKGRTDSSPSRTYVYYRGGKGPPEGIRVGSWKLRTIEGMELFNLDIDPSERFNRAEERPDLVRELTKRMEETAKKIANDR